MKVVERGVEIPVEKIKSSPFQPRMNFDLESLLSSISEDGILRPLWVRRIGTEEYELIDGERRLRAAKELGMQTVPCDIIEVDDETARRLVWRLNMQQRTYGDKEKAYYFKRLHEEYRISINRIAKECGVHRHIIMAYLNIFRLPEKYQKIIWGEEPGNLTVTHIQEMESLFASETPIQEITEILDYVLENNLSKRELRQFLKSRKETGKAESVAPAPPPEAEKPVTIPILSGLRLEKPEDYVKAAEELMRRAEELKSPEEKFREKAGEVEDMIKKLKSMHRDVRYYKDQYDMIKHWAEENPEDALKSLEDLAEEVRGKVEEAEREEMERRLEDRVAKRMFANPKAWRKRARELYYEELKEKFEVFRDRLVPKKAVKAIVDIYMDVGDDLTFQWVIEDLEKEVKRRREDPSYVKHGRKLNSSDVRRILEKHRMVQPSRPTILDDPDREKALEAYPYALVEFVWRLVPWKQYRLRVLKRLIRIMAVKYAVDGEIYRLLAWAIEETVPKMTWYSTGIPDKIRKLKETGKPEEFMYVSP